MSLSLKFELICMMMQVRATHVRMLIGQCWFTAIPGKFLYKYRISFTFCEDGAYNNPTIPTKDTKAIRSHDQQKSQDPRSIPEVRNKKVQQPRYKQNKRRESSIVTQKCKLTFEILSNFYAAARMLHRDSPVIWLAKLFFLFVFFLVLLILLTLWSIHYIISLCKRLDSKSLIYAFFLYSDRVAIRFLLIDSLIFLVFCHKIKLRRVIDCDDFHLIPTLLSKWCMSCIQYNIPILLCFFVPK